MTFIFMTGHGTLLSNGESLAVFGLLTGLAAAFFGQNRFDPKIAGAQRGRWLAVHWMRFPLLLIGAVGLVLIVVAKTS